MSKLVEVLDKHFAQRGITREDFCVLIKKNGFEDGSVPTMKVLSGEAECCIGIGDILRSLIHISEEEGEEIERLARQESKEQVAELRGERV